MGIYPQLCCVRIVYRSCALLSHSPDMLRNTMQYNIISLWLRIEIKLEHFTERLQQCRHLYCDYKSLRVKDVGLSHACGHSNTESLLQSKKVSLLHHSIMSRSRVMLA